MSKDNCKQCPLEDSYRFRKQCAIKTCKNFSPFTPSRCLGLDTKFASDDKTISDGELLHYKFNDKEFSIKEVAQIRKKSVEKVKLILSLYRLINHIREHENPFDSFHYEPGSSEIIDTVLKLKPLRIKLLGFKPWMFKYILDEKYVESVTGPKFKVRSALGLKTKEYSNLVTSVHVLSSGDATLFGSIV